jgi:hypothetical protein
MCRSELDRVRQQVAQHLAQSPWIADPEVGQPFDQVQTQGELLAFGLRDTRELNDIQGSKKKPGSDAGLFLGPA